MDDEFGLRESGEGNEDRDLILTVQSQAGVGFALSSRGRSPTGTLNAGHPRQASICRRTVYYYSVASCMAGRGATATTALAMPGKGALAGIKAILIRLHSEREQYDSEEVLQLEVSQDSCWVFVQQNPSPRALGA